MRAEEQQSRVFYELCALLLTILRSPHVATPSAAPLSSPPRPSSATAGSLASRRRRRLQVSPAGFASLLLGASLALMLCGSVTLFVGFILMPWVMGLVMVFYFVGVVWNLSGFGRAILCTDSSHSATRMSTKEMPCHRFSKLPID